MTCFDYHYHYYHNPLRFSCFVQVRALNLLYNANMKGKTKCIQVVEVVVVDRSQSPIFRKTVEIKRFALLAAILVSYVPREQASEILGGNAKSSILTVLRENREL